MADSVIAVAELPNLSLEVIRHCGFPWEVRPNIDMRMGAPKGRVMACTYTVPGYAPQTFFKASVLLDVRDDMPHLAGYLISFNASCVTGTNALLVNGVPKLAEIALLRFKNWLLDQSCKREGIDMLRLEELRLVKATPTFLQDCGSADQALEAANDFALAAEIQNAKVGLRMGKNGKSIQPSVRAFSVGPETGRKTHYVQARDHLTGSYVKDPFAPDTKHHPDPLIDEAIFNVSNRMLRPGVELHRSWLIDKGGACVEDWRAYGDERMYKEAFAQMCRDLRLDDDLRFRRPKDTDLVGLASLDREVLEWHLDADDAHQARNHPAILAKGDRTASYFSDMKLRMYNILRIDISIPWKKQVASARAAARLREVMVYRGFFQPPDELADDVFSPQSARRIVWELKTKIEARRNGPRGIGRTLVHPDMLESPPVELGRLSVSEMARAHMKSHKMPKHHLFSAHRWGVFGDVSKAEVLRLAAAAANRQTVRSRYRVGGAFVTVTTEFTGETDSATHMAMETELAPNS